MPTPILATKLYIPPPQPRVVLRPRLIERLNESLNSRLTLICAPAGFGKSTLISEWLAGGGRQTAWLSLEEGDNDPTRFLAYLIAALQTVVADIGEGVLGMLGSPQPPPTESVLTILLNEIATVEDDLVLVLDDYHTIDARAVDNILAYLLDHLPPRPGQEVLIIGASGGVGTYAVQIAKAFGAEVTSVCSTQKVDMVRSIGADHVIDYTREDFAEGDRRYDLILDIGGNSTLARLRRALTPEGTLVITGGETDGRWLGGTDRQIRALVLSRFVGQKLGTFISSKNHEDMIVLKELVESGKVTPVIDRIYPLSEVAEAIRYLEEGHARGKVVITLEHEDRA